MLLHSQSLQTLCLNLLMSLRAPGLASGQRCTWSADSDRGLLHTGGPFGTLCVLERTPEWSAAGSTALLLLVGWSDLMVLLRNVNESTRGSDGSNEKENDRNLINNLVHCDASVSNQLIWHLHLAVIELFVFSWFILEIVPERWSDGRKLKNLIISLGNIAVQRPTRDWYDTSVWKLALKDE